MGRRGDGQRRIPVGVRPDEGRPVERGAAALPHLYRRQGFPHPERTVGIRRNVQCPAGTADIFHHRRKPHLFLFTVVRRRDRFRHRQSREIHPYSHRV